MSSYKQLGRGGQIVRDYVSYRDGLEKLLKGIDQDRERFNQTAKHLQVLQQGRTD